MTAHLFRLECRRMLRDPRYLALAVLAPVGFYLLFATLFGGQPAQPGQLRGTVEIMVAMAAYGAVWGALSATGPRLAQERGNGWLEQLRGMPITARQVMTAKLASGLVIALPALLLVCATAVLAKGVRLPAWEWAAMVPVMWLGSLPFALMGIAIGVSAGPETAFPLSYGLYMAMSALGGLWVPPAQLPASMQHVAHALPTYQLADLGWRLAAGHAPTTANVAVLAAWSAGFALLAALGYRGPRRAAARRAAALAAAAAPAAPA